MGKGEWGRARARVAVSGRILTFARFTQASKPNAFDALCMSTSCCGYRFSTKALRSSSDGGLGFQDIMGLRLLWCRFLTSASKRTFSCISWKRHG
ncbi:hypothetical protein MESS2_980003 [Mesorhizobium metallidurans STM 2683]|uniref:Uncharacterized protein n=1 Tax=Mesorhizobium metallidurans STM 2683 TaxID=1297569 RepID=M5FBK5_9HYPH|nr:hypothetical protein MESS2_980003 [Mesorhizobium metallidurans STM 2683]